MTVQPLGGLTLNNLVKCLAESPIRSHDCRNPPIHKAISEYQKAYKVWPWQPVRTSYKPEPPKISDKARHMLRKSTYGLDYVYHGAQRQPKIKKNKESLKFSIKPLDTATTYKMEYYAKQLPTEEELEELKEASKPQKVIPQSDHLKFDGASIYHVSYPAYDSDTIARCKQSPIKAKGNIDIPPTGDIQKNPKSTAQDDFVHHEKVDRPERVIPQENTVLSKDTMESETEYMNSYSGPPTDAHIVKIPKAEEEPRPFKAITTVMADFTAPTGTKRRNPCIPTKSNNLVTAPFDGRTTFAMAYKEWPVRPYELPKWAKKPSYKRSSGGMVERSIYKKDFCDPQVIGRTDPITPEKRKTDIITNNASGDKKSSYVTTYISDYKYMDDAKAPASYLVIENYKPPTEAMMCETNHCAHFKGEYSEKLKPCRCMSQHRRLHDSTRGEFTTTYNENYHDYRPKSCSIPTQSVPPCKLSVSVSATCHIPAPPPTPKSTPIPKPDLSALPKPQFDKPIIPSPPTALRRTPRSTPKPASRPNTLKHEDKVCDNCKTCA